MLLTVLYCVYSIIFPGLFGDKEKLIDSDCRRVPDVHDPSIFDGYLAWLRLHLYMSIFQPVQWWRHTRAINSLLDDIGYFDADF